MGTMAEDPYWLRYHREKQALEAAVRASRNPPPPPKATAVVPLLRWRRTITWWPRYDVGRHDKVTFGNDFSPAGEGYELKAIQDNACFGEGEDGLPITSLEVSYSAAIGDQCPEECRYIITLQPDTPNEDVVCENGFETLEAARKAATQALGAILQRGA